MTLEGKRPRRRWQLAAAIALLVVTVLAATIQGGVLAPKFDAVGDGTGGDARVTDYFNDYQNASWRSWTITGVRLVDDGSIRSRTGVHVIDVGVRRGSDGQGSALRRLTVRPGQRFSVDLVVQRQICVLPKGYRTRAQVQQYQLSRIEHQPSLPIDIAVTTPFGTRTVGTTFRVGC